MGRKDGTHRSISVSRLVSESLDGLVPIYGSKGRVTEAAIWNFLRCTREQQIEILKRYHTHIGLEEVLNVNDKPASPKRTRGKSTPRLRTVPEEVVHRVSDGAEGMGVSTTDEQPSP